MNERKKWKWVSQQLLISECMHLFLLIVLMICPWLWTEKMKYWIAMSTIIIFTISIEDISNWAIMVGKVRLNFG